jgi:hypothetical protein
VDKKRAEWLQKLNAEAQAWIAQSDIDKVRLPCFRFTTVPISARFGHHVGLQKITAELFEMTRPWQYDAFYANSSLKGCVCVCAATSTMLFGCRHRPLCLCQCG